MSESKAKELRARLSTIKAMATQPETREVCQIVDELIEFIKPDAKTKKELGFSGRGSKTKVSQ